MYTKGLTILCAIGVLWAILAVVKIIATVMCLAVACGLALMVLKRIKRVDYLKGEEVDGIH